MTINRLLWHLENWRDWMMSDNNKLGYPTKSIALCGGGGSGEGQFEIMCDSVDTTCAIKINAMIDGLKQAQKIAINHVWLQVKHHYPTHQIDYENALENLITLAIKRKLD